jgi:hypothetical protein
MNRIFFRLMILLTFFFSSVIYGINPGWSEFVTSGKTEQDTLKDYQDLYNGKVWINKFMKTKNDQFLFTNYFLPGTVHLNNKTYKNLLIKYDIYSDEVLLPVNQYEVLQLNKEMVDSFTIGFENHEYKFITIRRDTLDGFKDFNGYLCVIYNEGSAIYVKYKKLLTNFNKEEKLEFYQFDKIYLTKDETICLIKTRNGFYKALSSDIAQIKNYLKDNKLKVSKAKPESLIPVVRFYDSKRE